MHRPMIAERFQQPQEPHCVCKLRMQGTMFPMSLSQRPSCCLKSFVSPAFAVTRASLAENAPQRARGWVVLGLSESYQPSLRASRNNYISVCTSGAIGGNLKQRRRSRSACRTMSTDCVVSHGGLVTPFWSIALLFCNRLGHRFQLHCQLSLHFTAVI